jgi:hypothetical protein
LNYFNSCQRTTIGMTLLLGCLLIFLIRRIHNSQIHSGLSISRRPNTYQRILYNHLSSMISSTGYSTLHSTDSSTILANMVFHQDLKSHHIFGRMLQSLHRQEISPHLLLVRSIVTLFHYIDIHLA